MSELKEVTELMRAGLRNSAEKALDVLMNAGEEAKEDAEIALAEFNNIVSSVHHFKDYPDKALTIMKSASQGLATKVATITNEAVRRSYKGLLSESLSFATTFLGGAIGLFK